MIPQQYFVCPVSAVGYKNEDLQIPMARGNTGDYAATLKKWLVDIMYGNVDHEWGVVVEEKEDI